MTLSPYGHMFTVADDGVLIYKLETHPMYCFDLVVIVTKFYFNHELSRVFGAISTMFPYILIGVKKNAIKCFLKIL